MSDSTTRAEVRTAPARAGATHNYAIQRDLSREKLALRDEDDTLVKNVGLEIFRENNTKKDIDSPACPR